MLLGWELWEPEKWDPGARGKLAKPAGPPPGLSATGSPAIIGRGELDRKLDTLPPLLLLLSPEGNSVYPPAAPGPDP